MQTQLSFFLDPKYFKQEEDPRTYLLHLTSSCLINEINYYDVAETKRDIILSTLELVAQQNPEFILQLALYIRQELTLRSIANFVLAFATSYHATKPFVNKYFSHIILIPWDLKEMCQFYLMLKRFFNKQSFTAFDVRCNKINFPTILKTQIGKKFNQFSDYQLARYAQQTNRRKLLLKYSIFLKQDKFEKFLRKLKQQQKLNNKKSYQKNQKQIDKRIHKKLLKFQKYVKRKIRNQFQWLPSDEKNLIDVDFLHFKDLIRICHIQARNRLTCGQILGKKYPETEEEFDKKYKDTEDAQFDERLIGKKMKLQEPITWDKLLSQAKDKKKIWSKLILNDDIPYSALIKNIKYILQSEVKLECHKAVIDRIKVQYHILKSKIFPMQYLITLDDIDKFVKQQQELKAKLEQSQRGLTQPLPILPINHMCDPFSSFSSSQETPRKQEKQQKKFLNFPIEVIQAYKISILEAIKISIDKNVDSLPGTTFIFCDVSGSMATNINGGQKKYGQIETCLECGIMFALIIKMKAKNCQFYLFSSPNNDFPKPYVQIDFDKNMSLLEQYQKCKEISMRMDKQHEMIGQCLKDLLLDKKVKADNVIILSDMMITQGFSQGQVMMDQIIREYIKNVYNDVIFYFVDMSSYGKEMPFAEQFKSSNCRVLSGMSEKMLKFIKVQKYENEVVSDFCEDFLYKANVIQIGQYIHD